MSRRASEDRGTFTPVFDGLVRLVGPTAAILYGLIYRFSQMDSGRCTASVNTLARRAGVSERAAFDALRRLKKAGLLADETPGRRNAPHVLRTVDFSRRTAEEECPEGIEEPIGPDGRQELQTGMQELQSEEESISPDGMQLLQTGMHNVQSEVCKNFIPGCAKCADESDILKRLSLRDAAEEKAPLPGDLAPVVTSLAARAERARASHNAFFRQ